jgi:galactokinase
MDRGEIPRPTPPSDEFVRRFERPGPTHLVRAPGRVNLIGEHTDYNGLPVFPMAIQRAVEVAFRARKDGVVRLANVDPRFEPREFEIAREIPPFVAGDWGNYAKAAVQALALRADLRRGFDGLVDGDIPDAAGLSSSSALLVACALALLRANDADIDRAELMSLCARAERYVGTHSGGMDQAICLGGRSGSAVVIDFEPLRLRPTPVPSDWRFVVANTLVEAKKSGSAQQGYNARVRECREALRAFADAPEGKELAGPEPTYADLVARVPDGRLLAVAERVLPEPLLRRFRHVVTEAIRVEDARAAMLEGDLPAFGRAMNASHASLRDDYEVSCRELDALVDAALEHGAAGARLTGAGFGGCIVALCYAGRVDALLGALEDGFVAEPSPAAAVFEL